MMQRARNHPAAVGRDGSKAWSSLLTSSGMIRQVARPGSRSGIAGVRDTDLTKPRATANDRRHPPRGRKQKLARSSAAVNDCGARANYTREALPVEDHHVGETLELTPASRQLDAPHKGRHQLPVNPTDRWIVAETGVLQEGPRVLHTVDPGHGQQQAPSRPVWVECVTRRNAPAASSISATAPGTSE